MEISFMSVRFKALLFILVLPLVLISFSVGLLFRVNFVNEFDNAREKILLNSKNIRDEVYQELSVGLQLLRVVETNAMVKQMPLLMDQVPGGIDNRDFNQLSNFSEVQSILNNATSGTDVDLVYIAATQVPGLVLGRDVNLVSSFDVRGRDYYQMAMAQKPASVISQPRVSAEDTKEPIIVITAARAIMNPDDSPQAGKAAGVLALNYRINGLINIIRPLRDAYGVKIALYDRLNSYVLWGENQDGEYFFDPKNEYSLAAFLETMEISDPQVLLGELTASSEVAFDSPRYINQAIQIGDTRWGLLLSTPRKTIQSQVIMSVLPPFSIFILIFVLMQIMVYFLIVRSTISPIGRLGISLKNLSQNDADLNARIDFKRKDEIGQAAKSFNSFIVNLRSLVIDIQETVAKVNEIRNTLGSGTEESTAAVEQMSKNLESIGSQIQELNGKIEHQVATIEQISGNMQAVDTQIINQSAMIEESTAAITQMMASLKNLDAMSRAKKQATTELVDKTREAVVKIETTANKFKEVSENINSIEEMASTIAHVTAQTNLLSMNAAIEAAHAGEFGQGFSVVAEEIRSLATSSSKSTNDIKQKIKSIHASVADTDESVQLAVSVFKEISEEVKDTIAVFSELEMSISELSEGGSQILHASNDISRASLEIKEGSSEVSVGSSGMLSNAGDISTISTNVSSSVDELTIGIQEIVQAMNSMVQTAQSLSEVIDVLNDKFGRFKT
ncbi:MAG: methyl-accepting chemotaxis protein [Spirochaetaceae bacterium]|nr:MAG: methyl-accepting chemotaxis protein [Spirochaetaceae bacterium]